jgi:hypothetical protein
LTDEQKKAADDLLDDAEKDPLMYREVFEEYIWMRDRLKDFISLLEVAK